VGTERERVLAWGLGTQGGERGATPLSPHTEAYVFRGL